MSEMLLRMIMAASALSWTPAALAESVSNKVTGYQVSLYRPSGGDADFQGWIQLTNETGTAGYIYVQNGMPMTPRLGGEASKRYVVIDVPIAMLGDTILLLNSGKDIKISYDDQNGAATPTAFLDVGAATGMETEEAEIISKTMGMDAASLTAKR